MLQGLLDHAIQAFRNLVRFSESFVAMLLSETVLPCDSPLSRTPQTRLYRRWVERP